MADDQNTPEALKAELARTKEELDKIRAQAEDHLNGWKRAKADYLNLKRDAERDKTEMAGYAVGALVLQLLPIADAFDRAMAHLSDDQKKDKWIMGMTAIQQQLQGFLADLGIEKIPSNTPFNPELHEAVAHEERPGASAGTILDVVTPGYRMHGKVLRPAQVKVAK